MAVNYSAAVKTDRMTVVRDAIDGGLGAGTLEICSAAYAAVLAVLTLADPCGTVSGAVLTFDGMPLATTGDADGTAALARFKDSAGNIIVDGLTVGTSGTNVVLNTTGIEATKPVVITSATITHG